MKPSIVRDVCDFRIFKYWLFSLVISIGFIAALVALGVTGFSAFVDPLSTFGSGLVDSGISQGIIQSAIAFLFGAVITAIVGILSWFSFALVLLFVLALFNESIIGIIRDKHYPQLQLQRVGMWLLCIDQLKIIVSYTAVLIVALLGSLVFIVFFGWLSAPLFLLWSFLVYRTLLLLDCGSAIFSLEQLKDERRMTSAHYWPVCVITYVLTLIPWINLLAPLIAIVWTSHIMLQRKSQLDIETQHPRFQE